MCRYTARTHPREDTCSPGSRSSPPFCSRSSRANRSEAQTNLSVVSARPAGETADRGESREITVVFSEPMVALGRIPNPVTAPFFKIQPALAGTFRWSGTSILIFTPDPKVALPFSTRYTVTVDASATAVSGRKLAAPYTFAFTTPTVKLLATNWYRRGDRFDGPVVIGLRFNQPVRPADLLQRLTLAYKTARLDAAGDVGRVAGPPPGDRPGRPGGLRGQGRRRDGRRQRDRPASSCRRPPRGTRSGSASRSRRSWCCRPPPCRRPRAGSRSTCRPGCAACRATRRRRGRRPTRWSSSRRSSSTSRRCTRRVRSRTAGTRCGCAARR